MFEKLEATYRLELERQVKSMTELILHFTAGGKNHIILYCPSK